MQAFNPDGTTAWSQNPSQYAAGHPDDPNWRTTYSYDDLGRTRTVTAPDPSRPGTGTVETTTCYTARGETAATIDPTGAVTEYTYHDQNGLVRTVTDPLGMNPATTRDCNAARTHVDNPARRGVTTYAYDGAGNRTRRLSWNDTFTTQIAETWTYDPANRETSYSSGGTTPVQKTTAYTLTNGRLTGIRTETGAMSDGSARRADTTLGYSGLTELVVERPCVAAATCSAARTVATSYNASGKPTTVTDQTDANPANWSTVAFEYNDTGNTTKQTYPDGKTVSVTWNLVGRPLTQTQIDGTTTSYTYNGRQLLETVDNNGARLATYTYNAAGAPTNETLGTAGADGNRSWDRNAAAGTLDRYAQTLGGQTTTATVTYDATGRISGDCNATGTNGTCQTSDTTTTYTYDRASQLTAATATNTPSGTINQWAYTYGNRGNRLTATIDTTGNPTPQATTYNWDPDNPTLLTSTTSTTGGPNTTYTHDVAGQRRTADTTGGTQTTYTYNTTGKLSAITTVPAGGTASTTERRYDSVGNLACTTTTTGACDALRPGPTNDYRYWDDTGVNPLPQILATNQPNTNYRYGIERIATQATPFSYDYLGSTPATGSVQAPSQPPYGDAHADGYGYRAEHTLTGLVHLRARDYDPTTGTFLTRDPLDGVDGTATVGNPYHYADNDPVNKTDPSGLRPGDGSMTAGQLGAACDSVGGRLVWWGDTGSKACMEPPVGRNEGGACWPRFTPGGDALAYHRGQCGVWHEHVECARGDWIPGANWVCQHAEGIKQILAVIAIVAVGVASGGAAIVALGGSAGIAIPTGGGALALAGGGTVAGGGAVVLSPAAAGALVGSAAGLGSLIHLAQNANSSGGGPKSPQNFEAPTNSARRPPTTNEIPNGYSVRVGPKTADYPNGYWRMYNQNGQPVDPSTLKPPSNVTRPQFQARTHVPCPTGGC